MSRSLYLINLRSQEATYFGAESVAHFGFEAAQPISDLATATMAAMVPADRQVGCRPTSVSECCGCGSAAGS